MTLRRPALGLALLLPALARPDAPLSPARAIPVCDALRAAPGDTVAIGVLLEIDPGWHVYWKSPGDAGLATRLDLATRPAAPVAGPRWPLPHRFDEPGGLVAYGYPEGLLLARPVVVPPGAAGRLEVDLDVAWLVCRDRCLEGGLRTTAFLPIGSASRPVNQEVFARFGAPLPEVAPTDGPMLVGHDPPGPDGRMGYRLRWAAPVAEVEAFPVSDELLEGKVVAIARPGPAEAVLTLSTKRYPGSPPPGALQSW